jgi:type I restriction enzyme S subunit
MSEWRKLKVSEFADIIGGGTPKTKVVEYWNGTIPWLTPRDLSNYTGRYICKGERYISEKGLRNSSARMLPPKTVLLTSRAPVGYLAISKGDLTTNQGFRSLIIKDGFCPEFIYYLLLQNVDKLKRHASGSTFQELSGGTLKDLEFDIPERITEQRAIAHILGSLDDKIELNRRMNETLEAMARTLFKSWFVDFDPVVYNAVQAGNPVPERFTQAAARYRNGAPCPVPDELAALFPDSFENSELGEIPKGWGAGKVSNLADVTSGKRPQKRSKEKTTEFNVPLYGGGGVMAYVAEPMITEPFLLTGRVGTLGKIFMITEACWPSDNTLLLFPKNKIHFQFLFFMLQRIDFESLNRGSTQPLVTQTDLKNQPLVIPTESIMKFYWENAYPLFEKIDKNIIESNTLASIRDTLLPKLISGVLRVPDAEKIINGKNI